MTEHWIEAAALDELRAKGKLVVRHEGKQVALFDTPRGIRACNNRCPHEGYPLSDGTLDGTCALTCNWHNWKFDLETGENLLGGDRLRVYPTELRDGAVWIDIADPPAAARQAEAMANLREAFDDHDYTRIAREAARLGLAGADLLDALRAAIRWSYDRLEFGWTHAYAGAADWLALYDAHAGDEETQLICLVEPIGHLADDVLRERTYPYGEDVLPYDEAAFLRAIEAEDEAAAIARLRGALAAGLGYPALECALTTAALAHYNNFGHALIYVAKAGPLVAGLGGEVAAPVLLSLVRVLIYSWREDLIPEFSGYAAAHEGWGSGANGVAPEAAAYRGLNVDNALALTAAHAGSPPEAVYHALLEANAANMLTYDLAYQDHVERPIRDNVGWLDFTHGITFANAVRTQCTKFPELWPAGLLQMACFSGRNAPYTDQALDVGEWRVEDPSAFFEATASGIFDHGRNEDIVSVHLLKTTLAARAEAAANAGAAPILAAALNRFLNSPLKRRHVRRAARQAMSFVTLDA